MVEVTGTVERCQDVSSQERHEEWACEHSHALSVLIRARMNLKQLVDELEGGAVVVDFDSDVLRQILEDLTTEIQFRG